MNEIKIIGISGQLQNGKDTVADLIVKLTSWYDPEVQEYFSDWKLRKFATILKKNVAYITGCDEKDLEDEDFKNKPLGEEWRRWYWKNLSELEYGNRYSPYFGTPEEAHEFFNGTPAYMRNKLELVSEILTRRMILQLLGTEGGRDVIHPNIWINATLGNLKENDKVIITDCRFPNEADGIKKRNGIVVRVIRPSKVSTSTHASETSLNDYKDWDYVIINDGTLDDLQNKIIEMLNHFNIKIHNLEPIY